MRAAGARLVWPVFVGGLLLLGACAGAAPADDDDGGGGGGIDGTSVGLLLLVDSSPSMQEEASALALGVDDLLDAFADAADLRIGVSTVSVDPDGGASEGLDPGEAGTLVGPVITATGGAAADTVRAQILCDASCLSPSALADDPAHVCGDAPGEALSSQYLDCLCGVDAWQDHCGSGNEEPLEAALLGLCGAVDAPVEACTDGTSPFTEGAHSTLIEDGDVAVLLLLTDEGDTSRRLAQGDADATLYLDAFEATHTPIVFAAIGPSYDPGTGDGSCLGAATTWGVERLIQAADETGGAYYPITDVLADCAPQSFGPYFTDLADRAL